MVDMGLAQYYAEVTEFGVVFTGYACGTDDTDLEEAWGAVKGFYGLE